MYSRDVTACFTGHRRLQEPAADIAARVSKAVEDLIQIGYLNFCAGGARGFDALASEAVLALKLRHPHIQLTLMLPFASQYERERGWSQADVEQYRSLPERASQVVTLSPGYRPGIYYRRNRELADASSACIAYMTRANSGTGYTVRYAQEQGLRVMNLAGPVGRSI